MKCPACQAKLMPVDGQMFCLQCGELAAPEPGGDNRGPAVEETTDPVLQRAIVDALQHEVVFRLPVSQAPAPEPKTRAFVSMRSVLAPSRSALVLAPVAVSSGLTIEKPVVVVEPVAELKSGAAAINLIPHSVKAKQHGRLSTSWIVSLVVLGLFVLGNIGLWWYYSQRVYPGVSIQGAAVGNVSYEQLLAVLNAALASSRLTVVVGDTSVVVESRALTAREFSVVTEEVKAAGREVPLPLVAVIRSFSLPEIKGHELTEAEAARLARQVAAQVSEVASPATIVTHQGRAVMIHDHPGMTIDVASATNIIREAYGRQSKVVVAPVSLPADFTAKDGDQLLAAMNSRLALSVVLKRRNIIYRPGSKVIAQWLVADAALRRVMVDRAQIGTYLRSLPGSFDRSAAAQALVRAMEEGSPLEYTLSGRNRQAPAAASIIPAGSYQEYAYCVTATSSQLKQQLLQQVEQTLSRNPGWSLGGKLRFKPRTDSCNFRINLVSSAELAGHGKVCSENSSCQQRNTIFIAQSAWETAPSAWNAGQPLYRQELIHHEVGQWLGFDHAPCLSNTALGAGSQVLVVLDGCSPNWYAVAPGAVRNRF